MKFKITIKVEVSSTKFAGKQVDANKMVRLFKAMPVILSILCSPMLQQLTWINPIDFNPVHSNTGSTRFTSGDMGI